MNKAARLDIRTTEEAKAATEDAAKFLGTTTSAFVLEAVMEKAIIILQQAQSIQLNKIRVSQTGRVLDPSATISFNMLLSSCATKYFYSVHA